jgi:hypothetical protein
MPTPDTVAALYPSKWLKADDLGGVAKRVTIAAVLDFERATKRMICNVTQCRALASVLGSDRFADWIGKAVTLAPGTAPNGKPTIEIKAG